MNNILPLDDVIELKRGDWIWLELARGYKKYILICIAVDCMCDDGVYIDTGTVTKLKYVSYKKDWRIWKVKPSEEMRKEAKWK